jgi:hypothetical protein
MSSETFEAIARECRERSKHEDMFKISNSDYHKRCSYADCRSDKSTQLKYCSGCKSVLYCSIVCQRGDWEFHKPQCSKLVALAANECVFTNAFLYKNMPTQDFRDEIVRVHRENHSRFDYWILVYATNLHMVSIECMRPFSRTRKQHNPYLARLQELAPDSVFNRELPLKHFHDTIRANKTKKTGRMLPIVLVLLLNDQPFIRLFDFGEDVFNPPSPDQIL